MNFYITATLAIFAAISNTQALPSSIRGLQRGGHGGSRPRHDICSWSADNSQPLLDAIQNQCDTSFDCTNVDTGALDCNVWDTNDILSYDFPTCSANMTAEEKEAFREEMEDIREDMFDALMAMTDEEREAFREEQLATDEANEATVLGCGCCIGIESIGDLVSGREGLVAKALKLHPEGGDTEDGSGFARGPGMGGKSGPGGSEGRTRIRERLGGN